MLVEHISLQNFGPYGKEVSIDFSGKNVVGIVGPNESGKSTILRAICYALFGKIPIKQDVHKVREVQLINDTAKGDLIVEAGLKLIDKSITIQRGRTQSNAGIIKLDGKVLKSNEAQELINEAIRISYDDFVSLSYFVQGDINQFMLGDKAAYFRRWTTSLNLWHSLAEYFKSEGASLIKDRDKTTAKKEALRERVGNLNKLERGLKAAKNTLAEKQAKAERFNESVTELTAQIKANETTERAKARLDTIGDQIKDLSMHLARLKSRMDELDSEFEKIRSGTCPILNTQCRPLKKSGQRKRVELNSKIGALREEIEENEQKRDELKAKKRKLLKKAKKDSGSHLKDDLTRARVKLNNANREVQEAHSDVAMAQTSVDAVKKAKAEIKLCTKREGVLSKKIRRHQFLQFMCGKSGIPSQIMEDELERVGERCNWILDRLDYQKRIRFSAYRELAGLEKVCPVCGSEMWYKEVCKECGTQQPHKRKDEPSVTVFDGVHERAFALESGGGQVLQSFAVRLAGSLFVASMLGIDLRMVMLDELFGMLDDSNRQKLMSLVIDKLGSEFGLQQQLVVSHQEDVINAVDDLLVVSKEHGCSQVHWS